MKTRKESSNWPHQKLVPFIALLLIQASAANDQIVHYEVKKPDEVNHGDEFQISVHITVKPDWYIYAPTGENTAQGMIETKVVWTLPKGIIRVGKMELPEPIYLNGYVVYKGRITMTQALKTSTDLNPGKCEIRGRVIWQTCNTYVCLPPMEEEMIISINIK